MVEGSRIGLPRREIFYTQITADLKGELNPNFQPFSFELNKK